MEYPTAQDLQHKAMAKHLIELEFRLNGAASENRYELATVIHTDKLYEMQLIAEFLEEHGFEVEFEQLDTEDSYLVQIGW